MKLTFLDYKGKWNQPSQFYIYIAYDRRVVKLGDKSLWGISPHPIQVGG